MSEVKKCLGISLSHAIGHGNINLEYSSAWAYGRHLVWGAQYSLPEQAKLTLIIFPKIVGGGGGGEGHQNFFPDIHTYKYSTKFSRHTKKKFT